MTALHIGTRSDRAAVPPIVVAVPARDGLLTVTCPHCMEAFFAMHATDAAHAITLAQALEAVQEAHAQDIVVVERREPGMKPPIVPTPTPVTDRREYATARQSRATAHETTARQTRTRTPDPIVAMGRAPFRYKVLDRRRHPNLTPSRAKVYNVVAKYPDGLLARDIIKKARVSHGTVQQTLNWLRSHKLVKGEPESE